MKQRSADRKVNFAFSQASLEPSVPGFAFSGPSTETSVPEFAFSVTELAFSGRASGFYAQGDHHHGTHDNYKQVRVI